VGATAAGLFTTKLVGETAPIAFEIIEESGVSGSVSGAQSFKGLANLGAYKIEKTLSIATEGEAAGRAIKISTRAFGDLSKFPGFQLSLSDEIKAPVRASFFAPSYDHHDWFVSYEDTDKRVIVAPDKPEEVRFNTVRAAALSSHYFTAAIADNSSLRPTFHGLPVTPKGAGFEGVGYLEYKPMTRADEFKTEQTVYIGPKDVDALRAADRVLSSVIDYGMFAVIAEPLVWLLRLFHSWFGNWGFAIIGLTIVVRLLVLPFNIYSFKSMKVMQKIQPQMQAVRERFKDDPRRMNEEVMRLMKENKANPLGGCLPMLLQLPVFFALYQVLAMSIELYRQPFVFWIHDLTVKDPFFVLPILMGVSMFVQQKITPVADPQQAKILIWMPVIFSALMFTLPSGLTLYIFVSTLFGIVQQYVLMRDKAPATQNGQKTVHQAKA
jgi:YidC/Oxa1 family membrane protein insertase